MNREKKFYWDDETISHFRFKAKFSSKKIVIEYISLYVQNECSLEDDETKQDLIKDLTSQVFNQKNTKK